MIDTQSETPILIAGLEFFDTPLLTTLSSRHPVIVVDRHRERLQALQEKIPHIRVVHGDITSRLTWRKLDVCSLRHVISTVQSPESNLEMLRLLREHLNCSVPVMILVLGRDHIREYADKDVLVVNPFELGAQYIIRHLDPHFFKAAHIGLGDGELVEVRIRAGSHLIGRRLKCLRPAQWRIAAMYRGERLILPTGNCRLKVGDRVILVGEPSVLESVAGILVKGTPQFPLQYGKFIVFPLDREADKHLDEVMYWHRFSRSHKVRLIPIRHKVDPRVVERVRGETGDFDIGPVHEDFAGVAGETTDMGMLVVSRCRRFSRRLHHAYLHSPSPILITGGDFPYARVIVSLNGPDPALALESGAEVARMMAVPFQVLYVTLPRELRGREEGRALQLRQDLVSDFESIYRQRIKVEILEGNPVKVSLRRLKEESSALLVITGDRRRPLSLLNPNAAYMIASRNRLSSLVIPVEEPDSE